MSSIMEALKKSDAERAKKQGASGAPLPPAKQKTGSPAVLAIVFLAILLAVAAGWWLGRAPSEREPLAGQTGLQTDAATQPTEQDPIASGIQQGGAGDKKSEIVASEQVAPEPTSADPIPLQNQARSEAASLNAPDTSRASLADRPLPIDRGPREAEAARDDALTIATKPQVHELPIAKPDPSADAKEDRAADNPSEVNQIESNAPEPLATVEVPPRASPVRDTVIQPRQDTQPESGPTPEEMRAQERRARIPELGQLPAQTRQSIGKLTLNVHMYRDTAADRFVLINLKRLGEGDSNSDGILVEEIDKDGVILSYQGTMFRLFAAR